MLKEGGWYESSKRNTLRNNYPYYKEILFMNKRVLLFFSMGRI